jgi:hypothetical protein
MYSPGHAWPKENETNDKDLTQGKTKENYDTILPPLPKPETSMIRLTLKPGKNDLESKRLTNQNPPILLKTAE